MARVVISRIQGGMSTQAASILILAVAAIGTVVWLVAVMKAVRMRRAASGPIDGGDTVVEGDQEKISRRITEALVAGGVLPIVPFRIVSSGPEAVRFRSAVGASILPLTSGIEGEYAIARAEGGKVRVRIRTNWAAQKRGATVALWICVLAGLPLLVGLPLVLLLHVATSPIPAVRWQAVQVVQMVHALWPPFLLMWLGMRNQRLIEDALGQVLDRIRFGG